MSTPEGKVKAAVKSYLSMINAYWFMPVQMGYGATTLDFLVCYKGKFFAIETKAPGKKMQPRQRLVYADIQSKGGVAFVIDDVGLVGEVCRFHGLG